MLCQWVENKYGDWNENHPASVIEFAPMEQTEAGARGCEQLITLKIIDAREEEPKGWVITCLTIPPRVSEYFALVITYKITQFSEHRVIQATLCCQIKKKDVNENIEDTCSSFIPTCELAIDWEGQHRTDLPVLRRQINLIGAVDPENSFILRICPPLEAGQHMYPSPPLQESSNECISYIYTVEPQLSVMNGTELLLDK